MRGGKWIGILGAVVLVTVVAMVGLYHSRKDGAGQAEDARKERVREPIVAPALAKESPASKEAKVASAPERTPEAPRELNPIGVRFSGRVMAAEGGAPIPGATLEFHAPSHPSPDPFRTTANEGGEWSYQFEQAGGSAEVVVHAPGFAMLLVALERAARGATEATQDFLLAPGFRVAGRVVDPDGRGIEGASVGKLVYARYPEDFQIDPYRAFPEVLTDASGAFVLEGIAADGSSRLVSRKQGYYALFTEAVTKATGDLQLVMVPGRASVEGQVLTSEGAPAAEIPMRAYFRVSGPGFRAPPRQFPDPELQFVRTDEQGRYAFPVEPGWQTVMADSALPTRQSVGDSVLVQNGEKRVLNLRFAPPLIIQGRFVEDDSEQPIANVRVAQPGGTTPVGNGQRPGAKESISDADGRFTVQANLIERFGELVLPPLPYLLPGSFAHDSEDWREERLPTDRATKGEEITIRVSRSILVTGVVLEADEATPAAGVGVDWVRLGGRGGSGGGPRGGAFPRIPPQNPADAESVTKADGRFTLKVIPSGEGAIFARRGDANVTERLEIRDAKSAPDDLELVLRPLLTVIGFVTDDTGAPLAGARINFQQLTNRAALFGGLQTVSDERGYYEMAGMSQDPFRVVPQPMEGTDLIPPDPINVEPEEGVSTKEVAVQYRRGEPFEGTVTDEAGAPISEARVVLARGGGPGGGRGGPFGRNPEALTGIDGSFLMLLPPETETFRLEVSHPSYDNKSVPDLFLVDSPVTIKMVLRGRVEMTAWSGGTQATNFEYEFARVRSTGDPSTASARTNVDGKVFNQVEPVAEALSPGDYRASVYTLDAKQVRDGGFGFLSFTVPEGLTAPLPIKVELGAALTVLGKVVTPGAKEGEVLPVEGAEIILREMSEVAAGGGGPGRTRSPQSTTTSGPDGSFAFKFIKPGRIVLEAEKNGFVQEANVTLELAEGQAPAPIEIRLVSGARISGTVLDHQGKPSNAFRLHLARVSGRGQTPTAEGTFVFENLEPREYQVILATSGGAEIERQAVKLGIAEQKEISFDLSGRIMLTGVVERNGEKVEDQRLGLRLKPTEGEAPEAQLIAIQGDYQALVYPGSYEVRLNGNPTGQTIEVDDSPFEQEQDIALETASVGIVIVLPDGAEFQQGQMSYSHRKNAGASPSTRNVRARRALFFLDNELPGEARAVYTSPDGNRYASDWTSVVVGAENILTLLPDGKAPEGDSGPGEGGGRPRAGN
jgi:hypothetical protein